MRLINFLLKDEQAIELKELLKKTGVPVSEQIRRAIDKYLNELKEKESKEKDEINK